MKNLLKQIREFNRERDWGQFHTPKNIAMALSVEAAEITECFQWLTQEQSAALDEKRLAEVRDEIGDVMIYLINLADKLGIDPIEAARDKIKKNRIKYPVDLARGVARKFGG